MVSIKDAFVDAWRSHRIEQGDDPADLPDPLGAHRNAQEEKRRQRKRQQRGKRDDKRAAKDTGVNDGIGGGGFLIEDDEEAVGGGGGFLPEDEDDGGGGSGAGGGGFVPDDEDEQSSERHDNDSEDIVTQVQFIPLSSIPDALTNLSLPSNDETVLKLFRDVAVHQDEAQEAEGTIEGSRRRRRGAAAGAASKVVTLADFERIAEVLTAGRGARHDAASGLSEVEVEEEEKSTSRSRRPRRAAAASSLKRLRASDMRDEDPDDVDGEDSDDEDAFRVDQDEDVDGDDDVQVVDDFRPAPIRRKRAAGNAASKASSSKTARKSASGGTRRARRGAGPASSDDLSSEEDAFSDEHNGSKSRDQKLTAHQRRQVIAAYSLLIERLAQLKESSVNDIVETRISKEDLRAVVRAVGEKIPDKEIDEMIDEGLHYFAAASGPDATRQTAKARRDAAAGRAAAESLSSGVGAAPTTTLGIDEFAGVLLKGRLI